MKVYLQWKSFAIVLTIAELWCNIHKNIIVNIIQVRKIYRQYLCILKHILSICFVWKSGEIPAQFYPYCNEYESCKPLENVILLKNGQKYPGRAANRFEL